MSMFRLDNFANGLVPLLLAAFLTAASAARPVRDVTFEISVVTSDGTPIPEAPVKVESDRFAKFVMTGTDGMASVTGPADDGDSIILELWNGTDFNLTEEAVTRATLRERELESNWFVPETSWRRVPEGATNVPVFITLYPAVKVTVRVAGNDGRKLSGSGGVVLGSWTGEFNRDPFVVQGVKKGEAGSIYIQMRGSPQIHRLRLSAAQTVADIDLGVVTFVDEPRTVGMSVTMTNRESLFTPDGIMLHRSFSLVRTDGEVELLYPVHLTTGHVLPRGGSGPPQPDIAYMPVGEFFIIPGPMMGGMHERALEALRAGRAAEFEAAGVPKIVAVDGAAATATFDLRATTNAVKSIVGE